MQIYKSSFVVIAALGLSFTTVNNTAKNEKETFRWFRTISEVIHLLEERHYKDVDIATVVQNALKAAVSSTDPHSAFFPKKSYKETMESTSGEFSGIGVSIMNKAPEDDFLMITDVIQGGPADKAGIHGGDKIVDVSGETLRGLSADEVVSKLRGKIGTTITLKIVRDKKPLQFTVKREIIKDQTLMCYKLSGHDIYYMSLKIFAENTPEQTKSILKKINGNAKGIMIDLRRNPGGILESAVDMASLFLPKNSLVVSTKNKQLKVVKSYYTRTDPTFNKNVPILILIDNFTASASEILAGCLQYYSDKNSNFTVFLVGTETFGKGSVQEVIPISNGCALKITTMLYYIPDNLSIQAEGIKPDFVVKPKITPDKEIQWVKELYGKESVQKNHITAEEARGLKPKPKEKKTVKEEESKEEIAKNWEERYKKSINQDVQIKACINMINMLNLAKEMNPTLVNSREKAKAFLKKHYTADDEFGLEKV